MSNHNEQHRVTAKQIVTIAASDMLTHTKTMERLELTTRRLTELSNELRNPLLYLHAIRLRSLIGVKAGLDEMILSILKECNESVDINTDRDDSGDDWKNPKQEQPS